MSIHVVVRNGSKSIEIAEHRKAHPAIHQCSAPCEQFLLSLLNDMNENPNTDAEAAYDIWLNGYNNEVMIWNDISNRGGPGYYGECTSTLSAQAVFGGSNGVPKHLWDLAKCGSELVWQLDQPALTLCRATSPRVSGPGEPP